MLARLLGDDVTDSGRYLAEVIYGANDGIVTTFAVVSGVAGAALNPSIVLVLGAANLLADGFSMGMSNYLSRTSDIAYRRAHRGAAADADEKPPGRTALVTFLAFVLAGSAPLFPYVLAVEATFAVSIAVTALAFFAVGASRSLVTTRRWVTNGLEMLLVGMAAASVAYAVGTALGGLV